MERSQKAFGYRVTKCLWETLFRNEQAADIGYAMICYADFAVAKGLNPKLRLIRTRTLMHGGDGRNLRYVMDA